MGPIVYLTEKDWAWLESRAKCKPTANAKKTWAKYKKFLEDQQATETRKLNESENKKAFDEFMKDLAERYQDGPTY